MLGCAVAEQPVGGSMCLWEGGLGQLFSHMHENCSCKQWVPILWLSSQCLAESPW